MARYGRRRGVEPGSSWLTAGVNTVYINPMTRSRVGRIAWSWFRYPVKNREFPAKHERLVTAEDFLRFGV